MLSMVCFLMMVCCICACVDSPPQGQETLAEWWDVWQPSKPVLEANLPVSWLGIDCVQLLCGFLCFWRWQFLPLILWGILQCLVNEVWATATYVHNRLKFCMNTFRHAGSDAWARLIQKLIHQAIKPSSHQAIKQSIYTSIHQAIKQSSNQAIKQSSNQAITYTSIILYIYTYNIL
jgi:hypothetical protein